MNRRGRASLLLVFALTGVLSAAAPAHGPRTVRGTVTRVLDGQTLVVRTAGGSVRRVRLLGIRAPVGRSCFAPDAKEEAQFLAVGRRVSLFAPRRAGRLLRALVRLPGSVDLGRRLVAEGNAQVDVSSGDLTRVLDYVPVQQRAEEVGRGLWGACAANVAVTLNASAPRIDPGDVLTYTATVTALGPLAVRNVSVDLRPPRSARILSAESAAGPCELRTWVASCTFDRIPTGGVTAVFVVRPTERGPIATRAHAWFGGCTRPACGDSPVHEANPEDNRAAALATVAPAPPPGTEAENPCDPHYPDVCIPRPPPFLHCADIPYRNFSVPRSIPDPDPHGLDGNLDSIGCQKDDY